MAAGTGYTISAAIDVTGAILNDDLPQRRIISLKSNSYKDNENETANIVLTCSNGSGGEVSVLLRPTDGTAIAGSDYDNTPSTVISVDGETSKTVTIPIIEDRIYELSETANLTLSNPIGGVTLGTQ